MKRSITMQKPLLTLSVFLMTAMLNATAQSKAGMISLGGGANGSARFASEGYDQKRLTVSPSIGYYYNDNNALGLSAIYSYFNPGSSFSYGVAPFWRHNEPVTERLGFYGVLSPSFVWTTFEDAPPSGTKSRSIAMGAGAGAYWFATPQLSLDMNIVGITVSHTRIYLGDSLALKSTEASFDAQSFGVGFSVMYHFGVE